MNEGLRLKGRGSLSSGCYYSIADCPCTDLTQIPGRGALPFGMDTIRLTRENLRPTKKNIFSQASKDDDDNVGNASVPVSAQAARAPVSTPGRHQPPPAPRGKTPTTTAAPGSPPCQTTASEVGPPGAPGVVSIAAAGLRFVPVETGSV